jgi:hypothetical protein
LESYPKMRIIRESIENPVEIWDFEQAENLPFGKQQIVVVEGNLVNSYNEFLKLFKNREYQNKEYLEILLLPLVFGG